MKRGLETHVVASKERKELSKLSGEVGTEDGGEGSDQICGTRDELGFFLEFLLVFVFLLVLTERLSLKGVGSVLGDLGEFWDAEKNENQSRRTNRTR